ncbi:unnamed protein product [Cyprideis torosa]|uniref:Serine racemase n=1 Tax=Cyprideis torosa TaxID=163714 RepID=A0A7R8WJ76_9CRUS|nr:unnamed protein product [Cyprideis torosa]CAG0895626.1 unnamed protein product [Cyprideis torosa]
MASELTYEAIEEAAKRLHGLGFVHETPVFQCHALDKMAGGCGRRLFFKAENLQKTGSFKARGASNAVLLAMGDNPDLKGVVTHSSGNHGQAVAYAAGKAGISCAVVIPEGTPSNKAKAIQSYGAELYFCEASPAARKSTCASIARERGFEVIHPCDDHRVMAGQGTIATEFLRQVPDLDAIVVPISGGGMSSGICVAARHLRPECKVFLVEPQGKELGKSLKAKVRLWEGENRFLDTAAESIRSMQVGDLTFPILCELAESDVFTVSDQDMIEGVKLVMSRMKLVVELASGAAVAAALSEQMKNISGPNNPSISKIGVILCGGNIDINHLPW